MGNKVWLSEYAAKEPKHYVEGRVVTKVEGMEKGSERVDISFVDGGLLTLRHEQDCCESVELVDYYGEDERGVILSFDERSNEAEAGEEGFDDDSGTWTFYSIQTTTGEIWLRWLGQSNGYYGEQAVVSVTNGEQVLVMEGGVPKLYVQGATIHDETTYVLAAEGPPGMDVKAMEQWLRMAGEVTKS